MYKGNLPVRPMSLIVPNLYLGDFENAKSMKWLMDHKITHILNCAKELPDLYRYNFNYCNLYLDDIPEQDIHNGLLLSFEFLNKALSKQGNVVLVHCMMGISRSSSMVIHYLMKKNRWSYDQAYTFVRGKRDIIHPNRGFVEKLKSM